LGMVNCAREDSGFLATNHDSKSTRKIVKLLIVNLFSTVGNHEDV